MKELIISTMPFEFKKTKLNESFQLKEQLSGGKMLVSGIIQRANTKNQNGRIYPKSILEKQVEKYVNEHVKMRNALGCLDHSECFREGEVLTTNGWKDLKDVTTDDVVATLNIESDTLVYQKVNKVINQDYSGKMISIKGKCIDVNVTPNHRFVLRDRHGKYLVKTAQEIVDILKLGKATHMTFPTVQRNLWEGYFPDYINEEYVTLPPAKLSENCHLPHEIRNKYHTPLKLNTDAFFKFLGFYLAEGGLNKDRNAISYNIYVYQNEGELSNLFRKVLKELSTELEWKEYYRENIYTGNIYVKFSISDARLYQYLEQFGNMYTKHIIPDIKNSPVEYLNYLFDWFLMGDGTICEHNGYARTSIFSVSKQLMYDFNEILLKSGIASVLKIQNQNGGIIRNRKILKENCKPLYRLFIKSNINISMEAKHLTVEEYDYTGKIYCISVDNGTFYYRNKYCQMWTGNSTQVELKAVSHNIVELHWEGDDLMGTIEVLPTPNGNILKELLNANITVGISSRGVGSVIKDPRTGADIVQNDFDIICWDMVSTPSTQGAFVKPVNAVNESVSSIINLKDKNIQIYKDINNIVEDILMDI